MNAIVRVLLAQTVVLLLAACGGGRTASVVDGGDTLGLKYAGNLTLVDAGDYTVATLRNPWDTLRTLQTYVLVDRDRPLPEALPEGVVVRVPLQHAMVYSSVHCSLLDRLGALDAIGGVCDLQYIRLPAIHERCAAGRIVDAGSGMSPDMEKIIDAAPDAILLSSFENSTGYGRIEKLGVPIVECADYMETSALGRAEWMRFYGLLFGRAAEADTAFARVEREYLSLRNLVARESERPTVFSDLRMGAVWYMPGGRSTIARLYADAGADYVFADYDKSGSVPLDFETVFDRAQDADIWLIKYNAPQDKTYGELAHEYAPYTGFRAFRERHVYGCNTGAVPYYEEAPFHPDRLLKDLIKIFHPRLLDGYEPEYFRTLAE